MGKGMENTNQEQPKTIVVFNILLNAAVVVNPNSPNSAVYLTAVISEWKMHQKILKHSVKHIYSILNNKSSAYMMSVTSPP